MFNSFKGGVKHLGSAAVICSALLSGTALAAPNAPEMGHIPWNWWDHQPAAEFQVTCMPCDGDTLASEIGHIGWDWWTRMPAQPAAAQDTTYTDQNLPSELGAVSWQWWQQETTSHI